MEIKQFYDRSLAHASYAVVSNGEMAVVDPARDPKPYYDFAKQHNAEIVAVFETHPHADFVSSHKEIADDTGATIYVSKLLGAEYKHQGFDEGDVVTIGDVKLKALNTPGHSPDSVSIVVEDEDGKDQAVFTGDTLFIGDVGRPDLRESVGNIQAKREELARDMYRSTRNKLMKLDKDVVVYPAHGAGSLCGKSLSTDLDSTIGREIRENYALQPMSEDEFVDVLLEGQPFIPKYFVYDVELNKKGADDYEESIKAVPHLTSEEQLKGGLIIDTRDQFAFRKGHIKGSINIPAEGGKFETWLGTVVAPEEQFYMISGDEYSLKKVIEKTAKIGYEKNIKGVFIRHSSRGNSIEELDLDGFRMNPEDYTIVDIRNRDEVKEHKIFDHSINIPLPELRDRAGEVPHDKPVVVHCAGGYRSTIGTSIIDHTGAEVYDLGPAIAKFHKVNT